MNFHKTGVLLLLLMASSSLGYIQARAQAPAPEPTKPLPAAPGKAEVAARPSILRDSAGQIVFPDVVGWEKEKIRTFPGVGAGYSVNYNTARSRVTVYEYNLGMTKIADELNDAIEDQVDGAVQAIYDAMESGTYSDVRRSASTQTVTLGGEKGSVKARFAAFTLMRDGRKMNSYIYVFPYKNNFIKLRVTRVAAVDTADDDAYGTLLSGLDKLFAQ